MIGFVTFWRNWAGIFGFVASTYIAWRNCAGHEKRLRISLSLTELHRTSSASYAALTGSHSCRLAIALTYTLAQDIGFVALVEVPRT